MDSFNYRDDDLVQDYWSNDASLSLHSATADAGNRRKYLVFLVPRPDFATSLLHIKPEDRNFDLAVRFYAPPGMNESLLTRSDYVMTGGLSKFHAAALFLQQDGMLDRYEGFLFVDGDVEFDAPKLSAFLSFVSAARLQLAQPSLTRDSGGYWKTTFHQPGYLFRETSFVEVMTPYLSRAALREVVPTFTQSISGYGLDLVWPKLLGDKSIGVVDAFQVRHREKVDHAAGGFYKYLKSINVDLDDEERRLLAHYGVQRQHAHSRRGFFWRKTGWPGCEAVSLSSVSLASIESRTDRQWLIDLAMRLARLRPARAEQEREVAIKSALVAGQIPGFEP